MSCVRTAASASGVASKMLAPGYCCLNPLKAINTFVVINVTSIHNVDINFCQCDGNVEKRQLTLNCLGKVSLHDFLRSLELLSNNDGLNPLPEGDMTCRVSKAQARASLPYNVGYKYFLFLAQDCNFRLINRNVGSAEKDLILGDGFGYFVNNAKYTEYLCTHVTEEEILNCAGFQGMFLANKKSVKGLRTTGMGGVTCMQHNMSQPTGLETYSWANSACISL
ncbi:hypothetical protein K438DRAFT_1770700 [Mycena galopus ATCC 62051]|nr:hypothetical protein K438DRAFT_1770700 [Mycena galopus ATCC 62051]